MTPLEAIAQADVLAPNAIGQDRKLRWLAEAEGLLGAHILHPGERAAQEPLVPTAALQVCAPWDSLYVHYLTMQIHYVHGDTARFNQANSLYRTLWSGFRDHHARTRLPEKAQLRYF